MEPTSLNRGEGLVGRCLGVVGSELWWGGGGRMREDK